MRDNNNKNKVTTSFTLSPIEILERICSFMFNDHHLIMYRNCEQKTAAAARRVTLIFSLCRARIFFLLLNVYVNCIALYCPLQISLLAFLID